MLDAALASVKEQQALAMLYLDGEKRDIRKTQLGALSDRLRSEIHRISEIQYYTNWRSAVIAVCGQELYEQCLVWIQANKNEEMK